MLIRPHRRAVLASLLAAPAALACTSATRRPIPKVLTPGQIEGPFYPTIPPIESDADLTRFAGQARAQGTVIAVEGRVFDSRGNRLTGAVVELWQANAAGRYAHPRDSEQSGPLDPGFQGWGKVQTDAQGQFRFLSIIPGTYLAARDWRRPPHLHFKIASPAGPRVTTQTYFGGHPLNAKDGILQRLSAAEQRSVTIDFSAGTQGAQRGSVDFVLPAA